ncbi:Molybdopterin synthase sulfur carrier subunit [Fukomys damarensis]|uniref:Molybdopterin synthase sulfur carrier subunit n=1 Tax=Fukomys damarensis TaxID=885580 RepID=A0A091D3P9_FUKDA|nr:Molybdopterin synthase sulfur carrier subunit [Fukomys damarensis]
MYLRLRSGSGRLRLCGCSLALGTRAGWYPAARLADIKNQVIFAVRQEYVELGDQLLQLQPGDEIAIIPPISGG